jgi:hypothetical protein
MNDSAQMDPLHDPQDVIGNLQNGLQREKVPAGLKQNLQRWGPFDS